MSCWYKNNECLRDMRSGVSKRVDLDSVEMGRLKSRKNVAVLGWEALYSQNQMLKLSLLQSVVVTIQFTSTA